MEKEKQCYSCRYGINGTGENIICMNCMINEFKKANRPDPYDCEWYDGVCDYVIRPFDDFIGRFKLIND